MEWEHVRDWRLRPDGIKVPSWLYRSTQFSQDPFLIVSIGSCSRHPYGGSSWCGCVGCWPRQWPLTSLLTEIPIAEMEVAAAPSVDNNRCGVHKLAILAEWHGARVKEWWVDHDACWECECLSDECRRDDDHHFNIHSTRLLFGDYEYWFRVCLVQDDDIPLFWS